MRITSVLVLAALCLQAVGEEVIRPELSEDNAQQWRFARGGWEIGEGVLHQTERRGAGAAIYTGAAFSEFTMSVEFNVRPIGGGVRAASLILRASGTMSYYWLHLDTQNDGIILVRSTPDNTWQEIKRTHGYELEDDTWNTARVNCRGPQITVFVNDEKVLQAQDEELQRGWIGLGTSQGDVLFRNLRITGTVVQMDEKLRDESPPHKIVSRGEAAGSYQAFPDACRLQNGDIFAVFYGGYGHISWPNEDWPKGGRICMVRSDDEARHWTEPQVLFDNELDNRDPHIAQISDGTLICSFFSLVRTEDGHRSVGAQIARSGDGGQTWEDEPQLVAEGWACSAPVRQMPDGTLLLGVYHGHDCGGVVRSTDMGETWSDPIPIGKDSGLPLDAETDVMLLDDGTLFAALRSSKINMHYATSDDLGLTWSDVHDIGFKGHCPHLYRLSSGEIILCHRVPQTSMHVSRDECATWEGPYTIDTVGGAYPATVELDDGSFMVIYYEEGEDSAIRIKRFRLTEDGPETLRWE